MDDITKSKLHSEIIWSATRQGGFQRSNIYNRKYKNDEKKKNAFRKFVKKFLFKYLYLKLEGKAISKAKLMALIEKMRTQAILYHKDILQGGELRFGNAQKFVNLYLKSMWLTGWGGIPPHFPVDSIILKELKLNNKYKWARMKKEDYLQVIKIANKFVLNDGFTSLAEWEAVIYLNNYIEERSFE